MKIPGIPAISSVERVHDAHARDDQLPADHHNAGRSEHDDYDHISRQFHAAEAAVPAADLLADQRGLDKAVILGRRLLVGRSK